METLSQTINQDIKKAMLAREAVRLNTLRMLKSAIGYAAIDAKKDDLSDPEVTIVIRKETKKRKDAHEQFIKGDRPEQAALELEELEILETYLPAPYSDEELKAAVEAAIAELGATSKREMGQVIKAVQAASEGRADGKAISQLVGKLLP
jgi:uncharacterized protein YqeY